LLAAASGTSGPVALLLTSDEEAGQSHCVRSFLEDAPVYVDTVVVAEPTQCRAVAAHRGLHTAEGLFTGRASHASLSNGTDASAIHEAARWIQAALAHAEMGASETYDTLSGLRLNVGVMEGGTKANVVASSARVVFGMRPLPNQCAKTIFEDLCELAPDATWTTRFQAPPLTPTNATHQLIESLGLDPAPAVDFWTEAALFAQAGYPSIVYGPGDIAQAHTAGEWVSLDQLQIATETYARLFAS
jgi:acetylornithine deacetylase